MSKVDWNSRVGSYTYNQAVAELGSPDKQSKLSDGRTVDQWITLHGNSKFPMGGGFNNDNYGMGVGHPVVQSYKDHVLELTFGPGRQAPLGRQELLKLQFKDTPRRT